MEPDGHSSWRFAVAGAVLVGGLLYGFVVAGMFRWSPYYWQWLAYHNGLVACVLIYLLLSEASEVAAVTVQSGEVPPRDTALPRDHSETIPPSARVSAKRYRTRGPGMGWKVS